MSFDVVDTTCWWKNETVYSAIPVHRTPNVHSALANHTQLTPSTPHARSRTKSGQSTADGYQFEIQCDKDLGGFDLENGRYHTDTLRECMELCVQSRPLCWAAAWNPDLISGYGNCYLKNNSDPANLDPKSVLHTPLGNSSQISAYDSTCNDHQAHNSHGKSFNVTCGHDYPDNDIVQVRQSSLEGCIDACASYFNSSTAACQCVAFQPASSDGFLNCFLKSAAGTRVNNNDFHSAVVAGAANSSTTSTSDTQGPSSESGGSRGSSKAWIAGPVIGALAALAIAGILFWLRRRHRTHTHRKRIPTPLLNATLILGY